MSYLRKMGCRCQYIPVVSAPGMCLWIYRLIPSSLCRLIVLNEGYQRDPDTVQNYWCCFYLCLPHGPHFADNLHCTVLIPVHFVVNYSLICLECFLAFSWIWRDILVPDITRRLTPRVYPSIFTTDTNQGASVVLRFVPATVVATYIGVAGVETVKLSCFFEELWVVCGTITLPWNKRKEYNILLIYWFCIYRILVYMEFEFTWRYIERTLTLWSNICIQSTKQEDIFHFPSIICKCFR